MNDLFFNPFQYIAALPRGAAWKTIQTGLSLRNHYKAAGFDGMAWWRVLLGIWLMSGAVGMAQTIPRDYAVSSPRVCYSADGATATVAFTVTNEGSDAREATQINITRNSDSRVIRSETLEPLAAGEKMALTFDFSLADFSDDDSFFKIEAGIDQYELAGSTSAINNSQFFRVIVAEATKDPCAPPPVPASEPAVVYDLWLPVVNAGINIDENGLELNGNRYTLSQILIGLAPVIAGLFLLWLLSLILRLLLYPSPKFGAWHPPYAVNVYHDPDSTMGRRQSWQPHAQNSAITAPCQPNHVVVLKRLLDMDGRALGGWKIKAIRTVQYDMYGHINRTEVIMSAKLTRQLNKALRRASQADQQQLHQMIQPIARQLRKAALKPIHKQNMMLPIALDFRFEGQYDEVRVVFELHQCRGDAWHLIDQWEPTFGMAGANIPESFTYTLQGLLPGETPKAYKKRLQEDMARLLAGLLHPHSVDAPSAETAEELTLAELLDDSGESSDSTPPAAPETDEPDPDDSRPVVTA